MIVVQDQGLTYVRCGHVGSILLTWNMSWSTYVFATKFIYDKECGDGKRRTSVCRSRWFSYLFFKVETHEIKLCAFPIMLPLLLCKKCSPVWPISGFVCVCVSSYVILPKCNWEEVSTEPKLLCPVLWEKFAHRYCVLCQLPLAGCFIFTALHGHKFL